MWSGSLRVTYEREALELLPDVAYLIQRALNRGSQHTMGTIAKGLLEGKMQLWTYGQQMACVTALVGENCLLLACGGYNSDNWLKYLDVVRIWARKYGCKYLKIHGRRGWARKLDFTIEGKDELGLVVMRQAL